jgi:hypothetical protein
VTTADERAEAWVQAIAGQYDRREDAENALAAQGVCALDTAYILDMIDMAYSRAVTHAIGIPLANMSSNVDNDPIFKAALRHFLAEMRAAGQLSTAPPAAKPWWSSGRLLTVMMACLATC